MPTDEQKRYRDRANRARRALLKEKEKFGAISDGSGKRYQACIDFILSDAFEGELFTNIRNKYIETFRALQHASALDARTRILGDWRDYVSSLRANEI